MVGDRVLTWKTALDLGFADFRSPDASELACQAEVELNRRFAPDMCLGVDALLREDGSTREHVVVMRRLSADTRLSDLVASGKDSDVPLHALARLLADFHSRCARSPAPTGAPPPRTWRNRPVAP